MINEQQLTRWAKAPSDTEETKCQNAVRQIKETIESKFGSDVKIYLQGSYRNRTNVRKDSDVDIVVEYTPTFFRDIERLTESQKQMYFSHFSKSNYEFSTFKESIYSILYNNFDYVERKNKCIRIDGNNYRVDADVVLCFNYRIFINNPYEASIEGIKFISDRGETIINFPKQHYDNGCQKNQQTNSCYKGAVRIVKVAKNNLQDDSKFPDSVSSFLIECLLWNINNNNYNETTWLKVIENDLKQIYNDCQNGTIYYYKQVDDINTLQIENNSRLKNFIETIYNYIFK